MSQRSRVSLSAMRWVLANLVLLCALANALPLMAGPILIFGSWDKSNCDAYGGSTGLCAVAPDGYPSDTKTAHILITCCVSNNGGTVTHTGVFHGFTLGPLRPGLMTVTATTWIDSENYAGLHQWGSVVSFADSSPATLDSWSGNCTASGCTPILAVTFAIELGTSFDVNLGDTISAGPGTANHAAGGAYASMVQFSFQEVPEPSTLLLLGVALMSGAVWCLVSRH